MTADLAEAYLSETCLQGASLRDAELSEADLSSWCCWVSLLSTQPTQKIWVNFSNYALLMRSRSRYLD